MKSVDIDGKNATLKLMSLRDVDMVKRDTARLMKEGYDEEIAGVVAHIKHGVIGAWFQLTEDGILDKPTLTLIPLVEALIEYNSPLGEKTPSSGSSQE